MGFVAANPTKTVPAWKILTDSSADESNGNCRGANINNKNKPIDSLALTAIKYRIEDEHVQVWV